MHTLNNQTNNKTTYKQRKCVVTPLAHTWIRVSQSVLIPTSETQLHPDIEKSEIQNQMETRAHPDLGNPAPWILVSQSTI